MMPAEPKRCLDCGYILEGLSDNRCPECGRAFDPAVPKTYWTKRHASYGELASSFVGCFLLIMALAPSAIGSLDVRGALLNILAGLALVVAATVWSVAALALSRRTPANAPADGAALRVARAINVLVLLGALLLGTAYVLAAVRYM
ncbi:MAG: hypothetical protein PVJ57_18800 [Phycisphaerae bacterium]|jgi:hypothetical protein